MAAVAIVTGIFFVAGLVVGGIVVIALAVLRSRPSGREADGNPPHHEDGRDVGEDRAQNNRPRWPQNDDNDHSGR